MITPHPQLIENIIEIGNTKARAKISRTAILAICAGAFIALGGMLSVSIGFGCPEIAGANPGVQKLLSALMFPVGLFLVVLFGAELFTGNNAVLMPGMLARRFSPGAMLLNWAVVWSFNFVGALLFTWLFVDLCGLTAQEPYHTEIIRIAETKANLPVATAFFRGMGANWLVCLAVWLALMVKSLPAKALACWIPVGTFVALGYEHSIANMYFIPAGMLQGAHVTIAQLMLNLGVVTLGNIAGGALLVGMLQHKLHFAKQKN